MTQFHPTTWIDQQRAAGAERGNVFAEIRKAADSIRAGIAKKAEYRAEARIAGVHAIKRAAADHDRAIDPRNTQVESFPQFMERWKGLR